MYRIWYYSYVRYLLLVRVVQTLLPSAKATGGALPSIRPRALKKDGTALDVHVVAEGDGVGGTLISHQRKIFQI